jgi:hypothetical protein
MKAYWHCLAAAAFVMAANCQKAAAQAELIDAGAKPFVKLFPDEGIPKGWTVRHWADLQIGFQELSRGGGVVEIRNARIKELD